MNSLCYKSNPVDIQHGHLPTYKCSCGAQETCASGYELTLHISCLPHSPCTDKCQNKGHIVAGFPDSLPNYNHKACTPGCWSHSNSLHSGHTSSQSLPVCTDTCLRCYTADSSILKHCAQVRQTKCFSILPGDTVRTGSAQLYHFSAYLPHLPHTVRWHQNEI